MPLWCCSLKTNSAVAKVITAAKLIAWDAAPMMHRRCIEVVDNTLRDIMGTVDSRLNNNYLPFGGKLYIVNSPTCATLTWVLRHVHFQPNSYGLLHNANFTNAVLLTYGCQADATPNLMPNLNPRIQKRGTTDMVYATVIAKNMDLEYTPRLHKPWRVWGDFSISAHQQKSHRRLAKVQVVWDLYDRQWYIGSLRTRWLNCKSLYVVVTTVSCEHWFCLCDTSSKLQRSRISPHYKHSLYWLCAPPKPSLKHNQASLLFKHEGSRGVQTWLRGTPSHLLERLHQISCLQVGMNYM